MWTKIVRGVAPAIVLALCSGVAAAAPTSEDLIFKRKHLANVESETQLDYKFERSVSDTKVGGEAFKDDITLKVSAPSADGKRSCAIQIFTGERARDEQKFGDRDVNPVFLFYFSRAITSFQQLAGGATPYLQDRFIRALTDKPTIETIKITYKGKVVEAHRISIQPFANDTAAAKMQGYDGAKFALVVSEAVPGEIVETRSTYQSQQIGAPKIEESIQIDGYGGAQ